MARQDDAKSALRALTIHADAILGAYLNDGGRIEDIPEHETIITTLKRHRLIWRLEETEGYQLRNVVTRLLNHCTETYRRQIASENVAGQWSHLQDLFDQYRTATDHNLIEDKRNLERDIQERLMEVIEDIKGATATFTFYVSSGFAYITDLQLRIQENRRVIERAAQLNSLLESFQLPELARQAGQEPFLKRLLLRHLPAALEVSRKDLTYALDQLRLLLMRLREDQRLNKLVGAFETHYLNNRGFMPSVDDLTLAPCPAVINSAAAIALKAYPDIYDPADENALAEIAAKVRIFREPEDAERQAPERLRITMEMDAVVEEEAPDLVAEAIAELIAAVLSDGREVHAAQVHKALAIELDLEGWLQVLTSEVDGLSEADRARLDMHYLGEPDAIFPDNLAVHDVVLRPQNGA